MGGNTIEHKGIISWFSRSGNVFGYIESSSGKEIYFDAGSLVKSDFEEMSVGDEVLFHIVKNELGEMARQIRKIKEEPPLPKPKKQPWAYK